MLHGSNMMELYESAMIWQGNFDITSIIPLPLIPHYIFVYCTQPKKRQYNNRLWIQLQSYSSHSPSLDQKKQPTPQKTTSSRWWFQKFVIFIPTKYLGKWFDFTNKMGGSTTNKSLYIPCFFSPKIGAFRRSWLPKPMPGSARASCAAVLATRPGSWMPCNDTSNGTALVFEGIIKWDPKLGVGGSNLMQIYRDLLRISLIVIVNCLGRW